MKTKIELIERSYLKQAIDKIDSDLILVVVDSNVWQIYGKEFEAALPKNKSFYLYKSLEGEGTKCFEEFERGIEFFLEKGIHRKAHVLAIGGGATSDYAGYLAASLLRGISWSIIPTTLLSMVDAAIGGKTGLNTRQGKNLVGAFHLPDHVWIDRSFLDTLSEDEIKSGMSEVIKYAFLNEEVRRLIENGSNLKDIIKACADAKEEVVEKDFKEGGLRMSLNLGHTFGHAVERIYDTTHGEAVFWGMALIFKLFQEDSSKYLEALREFSEKLNVQFGDPPWLYKTFPVDKIMDYLEKDKKKSSISSVKIIKMKDFGEFASEEIELSEIEKKLEDNKNELKAFNF